MPNTMVLASIASTYRFWFNVFGRIVRPRLDRMFRVRTSAGRSAVCERSMPTDALDGVRRQRLADAQHGEQLVQQPLEQRDLAGGADDRDLVAADPDVQLGERPLDGAQQLVARAEQADHLHVRRDDDRVRRHIAGLGTGIAAGFGDGRTFGRLRGRQISHGHYQGNRPDRARGAPTERFSRVARPGRDHR